MRARRILASVFAFLALSLAVSLPAYADSQTGAPIPQGAPAPQGSAPAPQGVKPLASPPNDAPISSERAGLTVHGNIQVGEEYNDNVNDTNRPKADMVTRVNPGLDLTYVGNRASAEVSYRGDLRLYNTGRRPNEMFHTLNAKGLLDVIPNTLVLDVSDQNLMVFRDIARGTPSGVDSTRNQVNQNIASAGLTLTPNLGERTRASLGYRITATLYGSRQDPDMLTQDISLDVMHELTDRMRAGFDIVAERQLVDQNGVRTVRHSEEGDVTRVTGTLVGNYAYSQNGSLFCRGGAIYSLYDTGATVVYPTWSAGLTHTLGKTTFTLQTDASYQNNPGSSSDIFQTTYVASMAHAFGRGTVTLRAGYSRYFGQTSHYDQDLTIGVDATYDLTERLKLTVGAHRAGWDENASARGNPIRYYGEAELAYQLPKNFSVKLYYQGKITPGRHTRQSGGNVNVVGIGLQYSF